MNLPPDDLHTTDWDLHSLQPLSQQFEAFWYLVVLVGCDGDKLSLGEHERVLPPSPPQHVPGFDHVNPGLVAVQRVQDYLQREDVKMHPNHKATSVMQPCALLCGTYMSMRVQRVVGELGIVKGDGSALPVSTCGR